MWIEGATPSAISGHWSMLREGFVTPFILKSGDLPVKTVRWTEKFISQSSGTE